jgi:hypothetical protein
MCFSDKGLLVGRRCFTPVYLSERERYQDGAQGPIRLYDRVFLDREASKLGHSLVIVYGSIMKPRYCTMELSFQSSLRDGLIAYCTVLPSKLPTRREREPTRHLKRRAKHGMRNAEANQRS